MNNESMSARNPESNATRSSDRAVTPEALSRDVWTDLARFHQSNQKPSGDSESMRGILPNLTFTDKAADTVKTARTASPIQESQHNGVVETAREAHRDSQTKGERPSDSAHQAKSSSNAQKESNSGVSKGHESDADRTGRQSNERPAGNSEGAELTKYPPNDPEGRVSQIKFTADDPANRLSKTTYKDRVETRYSDKEERDRFTQFHDNDPSGKKYQLDLKGGQKIIDYRDGRREFNFTDGSKVTKFPPGDKFGREKETEFPKDDANNRLKRTDFKDGSKLTSFNEKDPRKSQTTFPEGDAQARKRVTEFKNPVPGQPSKVTDFNNKFRELDFPNGRVLQVSPEGAQRELVAARRTK